MAEDREPIKRTIEIMEVGHSSFSAFQVVEHKLGELGFFVTNWDSDRKIAELGGRTLWEFTLQVKEH